MIAMSSSSINDQAALTSDHVSCVQDMSQKLLTELVTDQCFSMGINQQPNLIEEPK